MTTEISPAANPRCEGDADKPLYDPVWASRSAEELRAIVAHGLQDDGFAGAARELERRARDLSHAAEATSQTEKQDLELFSRFLLIGLVVLGLGGLAIGLFVL